MAGVDKDATTRVEALLAAHGADPGRWPAAERKRFAASLGAAELSAARREAAALDALLSRASTPQAPAGAVGRLMTRVANEGASKNVIDLSEARRRFFRPWRRGLLPAASALAASLLIGIYLGATGLGDRLLQPDLTVDESFELAELDGDLVDRATGFLEEDEVP
jgi:hypothetical protein